MDTLLRDLRYGARVLLRSPGFTLAAVLTLALGIGANTTIFSLVNAVLLRPPPHVQEPERLVSVYTSDFSGPRLRASSYPDYLEIRALDDVFEGVIAYTPRALSLNDGTGSEVVFGEMVTGNYFDVLGIQAAHGRTFLPEESATRGTHAVAVISHGLWQSRFGGDPQVVGGTVRLNGYPFTVIGVAPAGFQGSLRGLRSDVWVTWMMNRQLGAGGLDIDRRGDRGLLVTARLRPGATIEQARARLDLLALALRAAYPDAWTDIRGRGRLLTALPERDARLFPMVRGPVLGLMGLLMAVVALVLLIGCANVANLLLARAAGRRREVAARLALGAGRWRLVRQLLTESVLLAALGGAAGVFLALWATDLLMRFDPPLPVPVDLDLGIDGTVLGFGLAVTMLTGIVFGLVPALRATRLDLVSALKNEQPAAGRGLRRIALRDALVVGQIAACVVLLAVAGLFVRGLQHAHTADPGFDTSNMLLLDLPVAIQGYDEARARGFYDQLAARLEALPGVRAVTLADNVPLGLDRQRRFIAVEGYEPRPGEDMEFDFNIVGVRYFETMGIPLVRGRASTAEDRAGSLPVVVVNETFARRFWPGEDALGKRIRYDGERFAEVVGVARDGKYRSLTEEPRPYVWIPFAQQYRADMTVHIRTAGDPLALAAAVRAQVRALDPDLPITGLKALEEHFGLALLPQRAGASLLGSFGVLGLLLAAVGLYGVVAYGVGQRTREIGIRMALGARTDDVTRLVVRQGAALGATGLAIGVALAAGAARLITGLLYGVRPLDPVTFAAVALVLGGTVLAASWLPARRAARVDPMAALRGE
ncbi:MAG TPA: ABC transporter permease [Planctomycetota bacterium]|nr:ABC transporter permease [Planctomycetota bacterium]